MASWSSIARRVRVPLGFVFAALYLWLAKPTLKSVLIGVGLVIPGLMIRALASGHLQKNEQLATGGPYAHSRNPLYLGSLIARVGVGPSGGELFVFLQVPRSQRPDHQPWNYQSNADKNRFQSRFRQPQIERGKDKSKRNSNPARNGGPASHGAPSAADARRPPLARR